MTRSPISKKRVTVRRIRPCTRYGSRRGNRDSLWSRTVDTTRGTLWGLWSPIRCCTTLRRMDDDETVVCNVQAVSFVPLLTKRAIEFHSLEEQERGGVLLDDDIGKNTLQYLAFPPDPSFEEHRQQHLCLGPGQRFRFLTEGDPSAVLQVDTTRSLPLHWTVIDAKPAFEVVLEAMFRFDPQWNGVHAVFHAKEGSGYTALELACTKPHTQHRDRSGRSHPFAVPWYDTVDYW